MRLLLSASTFVLLVFLLTIEGGLTSCTKDNTIYDTVTVTKRDTVTIKDTVTVKDTVLITDSVLTESILTSHPWKLIKVIGVQGGAFMFYERGGTNNTQSFDNAYYTFNADKTGVVVDNSGTAHTVTTWSISNSGKTMSYTMYNSGSITSDYTWDNIKYKDGALYYDDYFHDNFINVNTHSQEVQIAK